MAYGTAVKFKSIRPRQGYAISCALAHITHKSKDCISIELQPLLIISMFS